MLTDHLLLLLTVQLRIRVYTLLWDVTEHSHVQYNMLYYKQYGKWGEMA